MAVEDLGELLARFRLSAFAESLAELGVETGEDLYYLQDADLERIGMAVIPRRKLLEACGADWRSQEQVTEQPEETQVLKRKAPPKTEPQEYAEEELGPCEISGGSAEEELEHLLQGYQQRVEDFVTANNIDMAACNQLMKQEPIIAVRACGLLGRGQAFVMHGMRKPSAAVGSRIRAATQEYNNDQFSNMIPYEDWPALLKGFADVNNVSASVRAHLEQLDRVQALRVMGFISGLSFVVPQDGDADGEVQARVHAALKGGPMATPRKMPRNDGSHRRTAQAPPKKAARHDRGRSPRGHGPRPPPAPPPRPRSYGGDPPTHAGKRQDGHYISSQHHDSQHIDERFPMWRSNLETFLVINELDDGIASTLSELPQEAVLRVMGLLGSANSFVIRGARNANAAVMTRVKSIHQHTGHDHDEAYANLPTLVEEFAAINGLDEKAADTLRQLPPQVQLRVMGFTAENSFIIRGVKNPSAALMGRMQQARKAR